VQPDESEYAGFVAARYGTLVRAAVLLGCRRPDAEDAAQDALIRCYLAWSRVRSADDPDAYVYRILVNGISRSRRRRWWGERPSAELPEPESTMRDELATAVSTSESVRSALARLRTEHREVLVLRYYADLSEHQTAQVLGIAQGTVKSRTSRAIAALSEDPRLADLVSLTSEEED
jgi:RNA polymerase sigma-70 factor (sigma-E family)